MINILISVFVSFLNNYSNLIYTPNIKFDTTNISVDSFRISILTKYILIIKKNEDRIDTFNVALSQRIRIFYNDKLSKEFPVPVRKSRIYYKRYFNFLDAPIWRISIIKGAKKTFFLLEGAGSCFGNGCPEFTAIYNLNGKRIYNSYAKNFKKEKFNKVLSSMNISQTDFKNQSKTGQLITVDSFNAIL